MFAPPLTMSFSTFPDSTRECLDTGNSPVLCLRFETTRERIAMPYSSLTFLSLAADETLLELSYVTHRVVIKGHRLLDAHCAIAAGRAVALCPGRQSARTTSHRSARSHLSVGETETMAIRDIKIETIKDAP